MLVSRSLPGSGSSRTHGSAVRTHSRARMRPAWAFPGFVRLCPAVRAAHTQRHDRPPPRARLEGDAQGPPALVNGRGRPGPAAGGHTVQMDLEIRPLGITEAGDRAPPPGLGGEALTLPGGAAGCVWSGTASRGAVLRFCESPGFAGCLPMRRQDPDPGSVSIADPHGSPDIRSRAQHPAHPVRCSDTPSVSRTGDPRLRVTAYTRDGG